MLGSGEVGLVVRLDGGGVRVELGLRFEADGEREGAMEKGEEGELGERGFCVEVVVSADAWYGLQLYTITVSKDERW